MRLIRSQDRWERAFIVITLALSVIVLTTFRDYGVSWDDEFSRAQGADFIRWWTSGFRDRTVLSTITSEYIYGALFSAPAAALGEILPFGKYEGIHLAIALTGILGVVVTFLTARRLAGSRAGFFAALMLMLTPVYYGHSFINPKDLPVAAFYITSVYALLVLYDELPRPGARRIVLTGLALGLPISVRVGSIMVFGYALLLAVAWIFTQRFKSRATQPLSGRDIRRILAAVMATGVIAWIFMIIWWPFAQVNPIMNPLSAIVRSATFNGAGFTNLFRGQFIFSSMLPREYLPVLLVVTLPEFYFVGLVAFVAAAVRRISRGVRSDPEAVDRLAKLGFFAMVAAFPIFAAVVLRPTVYDSTRLFLFVIPPLAVVAAIGVNWLFSLRMPGAVKAGIAAALLVDAGFVVRDMVALHPYQYAFFNRISGGVGAAYGRFDTEYWGTSYKEGIEWLARNYEPDAPPGSIAVANPSNPFLTYYYLHSAKPEVQRFKPVDIVDHPDVVLSLTRWNQHLVYGRSVLHIIEREGVPFLYVLKARSPDSAEDSTMRIAIRSLYTMRDPRAAENDFRKVLSVDPDHYGAMQGLAIALDQTGRSDQSRPLWQKVLLLARASNDNRVADLAGQKLASPR
jgi:hypothetical protein